MKIGIIGAGHIGGTLTRRLRKLGHEVFVANSRNPGTLKDLADATGAHAVEAREAAHAGKFVVVTVPEGHVPDVAKLFADVPDNVVVIDTCNYYPERDGRIPALEDGTPQSKWVSEQLGHKVIKAFNNMRAEHLLDMGEPKGTPERIALPVAGDDPAAKDFVMKLVDDLGFDPVDAGGLDESWKQQPGTPVYTADLHADGVRKALAEARQ
jgi:hypothetical protein